MRIFNEEFLNTLKDKTTAELDNDLTTIKEMVGVVERLRDYKQAKAIWERKHKE